MNAKGLNPIILTTIVAPDCKDPAKLAGLTVIPKRDRGFHWEEYLFPEFGPKRCYQGSHQLIYASGIVIPLGGKRYRIRYSPLPDDDRVPRGGAVECIPTTDAETPYQEPSERCRLP